MKRILFLVNDPGFFVSHRLAIAEAATKSGFEVHVATPPGEAASQIEASGLIHHPVKISRSGTSVREELRSFWGIFRLLRRVKPEIVHLVTVKPVLYGGIAARLANVPGVVVAISGLGSSFSRNELRMRAFRRLLLRLYRIALSHSNIRVIFQNPHDRNVLVKSGAVPTGRTALIKGSGVSIEQFPYRPEPGGIPVVSLASRLIEEKGVREYVTAARLVKTSGTQARFFLIGAPDAGNPGTIPQVEIEAWRLEGDVEVLGPRTDVAELFSGSNIICLPSYYGEGLPKVLIEAAACGRAVVTTDWPGCRDAIVEGVTGLLVPPRDAEALAGSIRFLIEDQATRMRMGMAARCLAEREYNIDKVVSSHLEIYRELLIGS